MRLGEEMIGGMQEEFLARAEREKRPLVEIIRETRDACQRTAQAAAGFLEDNFPKEYAPDALVWWATRLYAATMTMAACQEFLRFLEEEGEEALRAKLVGPDTKGKQTGWIAARASPFFRFNEPQLPFQPQREKGN